MESIRLKKRQMMFNTFCGGLVVMNLGVRLSQQGPAFLDIQSIAGTDVEGGSFFFTGISFGYLGGSLLAGVIYNRVAVKSSLIWSSVVLAALFNALVPWCANYAAMLVVHTVIGVFCGISETTLYSEEFRMREGKSNSALQFFSFSFSFGGILGPLITEPFLGTSSNSTEVAVVWNNSRNSTYWTLDGDSRNYTDLTSHSNNQRKAGASLVQNDSSGNSSISSYTNEECTTDCIGSVPRIYIAYLITAMFGILVAIPFFIFFIKSLNKANSTVPSRVPQQMKQRRRKIPIKTYFFLGLLSSSLPFIFTMVEEMFGFYLSSFVVSQLNWSKEEGAVLTAVYWGTSTAVKLLLIFIVKYISVGLVNLLSLIGMLIGFVILIIAGSFKNSSLIWLSTIVVALAQSALYGGVLSWADTKLIEMDSKLTSCAMIAGCLGSVINPVLLGVAWKKLSPMAYPYVLLVETFILFAIFVIALVFIGPVITRKYGLPHSDELVHETEIEEKCQIRDSDNKLENGQVSQSPCQRLQTTT